MRGGIGGGKQSAHTRSRDVLVQADPPTGPAVGAGILDIGRSARIDAGRGSGRIGVRSIYTVSIYSR